MRTFYIPLSTKYVISETLPSQSLEIRHLLCSSSEFQLFGQKCWNVDEKNTFCDWFWIVGQWQCWSHSEWKSSTFQQTLHAVSVFQTSRRAKTKVSMKCLFLTLSTLNSPTSARFVCFTAFNTYHKNSVVIHKREQCALDPQLLRRESWNNCSLLLLFSFSRESW